MNYQIYYLYISFVLLFLLYFIVLLWYLTLDIKRLTYFFDFLIFFSIFYFSCYRIVH